GGGVVGAARRAVVARQLLDRHLDDDRVGVEAADAIDAGAWVERDQVEVVERTEAGQVEDRAEVDEEGVVALAGEDPDAPGQIADGCRGERLVLRRRAGPDVNRWRPDAGPEDGRPAVLPAVPVAVP